MIGVETVGEAIHELQFGAQLEERKVEVASYADFKESIEPFQFYYVIVFAR